MGTRGRPSAASLQIRAATLETMERPRPPHDLTDEEVEVWAAVVNSEVADYFTPATVPLLAQYCRHVVNSKRVAELTERSLSDPNLSVADYDRLLKMQERESRCIAALAAKMRLSQTATRNDRLNKRTISAVKPWEAA